MVEKESKTFNYSNLFLRFISGIFIILIFMLSILYYPKLFLVVFSFIAFMMASEWALMVKRDNKYLIYGYLLLAPSIFYIFSLIISNQKKAFNSLLVYFILIWIVDSFAMIGGKLFGGIKLAPNISPNKTYSGLISGITACGIAFLMIKYYQGFEAIKDQYFGFKLYFYVYHFSFGVFFGIIAQASDLLVSYFKRKFNIKDTGNIIPGHGGFLDRFDSIILTAPLIWFIL